MKPNNNAPFTGLRRPAAAVPTPAERRRALLAAQNAELAAAKANRERTAAPKPGDKPSKMSRFGLGKPGR